MGLLIIFVLVLLLGVASHVGWTVDSRDGADWRPTDDGSRACGAP